MSHISRITLEIKEIPILAKAFATFNWNMVPAGDVNHYIAQSENQLDRIDINVDLEGKVTFACDFWGGRIETSLGHNFNKLKHEYSYQLLEDEYAQKGAYITRTMQEGGVELVEIQI